jgi:hypothetical protein
MIMYSWHMIWMDPFYTISNKSPHFRPLNYSSLFICVCPRIGQRAISVCGRERHQGVLHLWCQLLKHWLIVVTAANRRLMAVPPFTICGRRFPLSDPVCMPFPATHPISRPLAAVFGRIRLHRCAFCRAGHCTYKSWPSGTRPSHTTVVMSDRPPTLGPRLARP